MRLTSLTSGLPFKSALWASAVFLIICAVAGFFLVRAVETTLVEELTLQASSEAVLLSEIYDETGEAGLVEALRVTQTAIRGFERFAGLFDPAGVSLIGPMSVVPDFVGTRRMSVQALSLEEMEGSYIVHVLRVDQRTLVVGRNDAAVLAARAHLIFGLAIFAAVITLTLLWLGLWASRMSLNRLDQMDAALEKVGEGALSARLPILGHNDQFDQVSMRVNQNLDHLERAVDSIKATASAIAHDLKTPLSHVQIALHTAADAATQGTDPLPHIEDALRETQELNTIFEAVQRISGIRAGGGNSAFGPVSLDALAEKAIEFLTALADQNGQTLTIETTRPARVMGDQGMLQQALINLVTNAIVHAGPGAQITIRLSDHQIEVRDTGPGAPEENLKRLLEPFARADTTRLSEGSGLGLALVSAVAERHDATIELRNLNPGFSAKLTFAAKYKP